MANQANQDGVRGSSVVFPLLLIAFGVMAWLWRALPDFNPWPVLERYWPLLLICVGAGMFWDRAQRQKDSPNARPFPIGSTLGTLLFIAIMAFLLLRHHRTQDRDWASHSVAMDHDTKVIELGAAKAVHVYLEMPAGELDLSGGSEHLLEANFSHGSSWNKPNIDYSVDSGVGNLTLSQQGGGHMMGKSDNTWNLKVTDRVPLELKIDVGAGRGDLHLSKVDLTRFELNIGAGQANVDLTGERAKDLQATIQGGVGEAIVRLPKDIGVVATVHGGLGSIDVAGLTKDEDGNYVNAAYGKSPNTIHLTVEGGIGHIKLAQE
jgi:hypothetical protein